MEIKPPSGKELFTSALLICSYAALFSFLGVMQWMTPESVRVMVAGTSAGVICTTFGLSVSRYGARAAIMLLLVSIGLFAILAGLGLL